MNNLPCFHRTDKRTGNKLIGLIDTGATNNYISKEHTKNGKIYKLKKSLFVKTIHGQSEISCYVRVNLFSHDLVFFVVNDIGKFDILLGFDGLRKINAIIDVM